ncbi:hypothetical protein MY520_17385, partial [Geodermatophilus sp. CPCC 205506]
MPFVLTVAACDDGAPARRPDGVGVVLEQTADGEWHGAVRDPAAVVDVVLGLVRAAGWCVGVGAGPPADGARTGAVVLSARRAVDVAR